MVPFVHEAPVQIPPLRRHHPFAGGEPHFKIPTQKGFARASSYRARKAGTDGLHPVGWKVEIYAESKDGQRVTIVYHDAPFIFGQLEVWDERPYIAHVRAIERSEVLVLSRKDFLTLIQSNHQLAVNLARSVSQLLYATGLDRRVKFFGRVEHLLANTLCSHAKVFGRETRSGVVIDKHVHNTQLAEILGVARKSVIQAMKKLESSGLIEKEGTSILIPDPVKLQEMARRF